MAQGYATTFCKVNMDMARSPCFFPGKNTVKKKGFSMVYGACVFLVFLSGVWGGSMSQPLTEKSPKILSQAAKSHY